MNETVKTSIKIAMVFIVPLGIVSGFIEFLFFNLGLLQEIVYLPTVFNDIANKDWQGALTGLGFSLFTAIVLILLFSWFLRKVAKQSTFHISTPILIRWFLLGVSFGLVMGLSSPISNQFLRGIIIAAFIVPFTWITFRSINVSKVNKSNI